MKLESKGDWKFWLTIGGIGLVLLFVIGAAFSLVTSFFVLVFKGLGFILGTIFKFAFSSIAGFALLIVVAYLGYRGYDKLKEEKEVESRKIEYTDEDFER